MANGQRQCGTPMIRAAQEEEEKEMQAKLSPEEFRVWRIKQGAELHHLSLKTWGIPLPPELDENYHSDEPAATTPAPGPTQET